MSMERIGRAARSNESAKLRARQKEAIAWAAEHPEASACGEELLDRIDFASLEELFAEDIRRSGGRVDADTALGRERFICSDRESEYFADAHLANINASPRSALGWLAAHRREIGADSSAREQAEGHLLRFLLTVIHESAHAHSFSELRERRVSGSPRSEDVLELEDTVGYSRAFYRFPNHAATDAVDSAHIALHFWNEGFTEWYAMRLMREYLRRAPLDWNGARVTEAAFERNQTDILLDGIYGEAVLAVDDFITALSQQTRLPRETIEDAIIRGSYSSEGADQFVEVLKELYPPEVVDELIERAAGTLDEKPDSRKRNRDASIELAARLLRQRPDIVDRYAEH